MSEIYNILNYEGLFEMKKSYELKTLVVKNHMNVCYLTKNGYMRIFHLQSNVCEN